MEVHNLLEKIEDDEEEECEGDIIEIELQSNIIKVNYSQLFKYSKLIRTKYQTINETRLELSKNLLIFMTEEKVIEENVISFFKLIQNKNVPISTKNYCDFRKLSDFFQVKKLLKILNQYKKAHFNDASFIINQILEHVSFNNIGEFYENKLNIELEALLYDKVNDCLQNDQFCLFPTAVIYRIIEKSDRNNISSDLLLDFILQSFDERYILFTFLNIHNLSNEKLDELIKLYDEKQNTSSFYYFQYIPINFKFIKSIENENTELKN